MDLRDNLRGVIVDSGYVHAAIAKKAQLTPAQLSGVLNKKRSLEVHEFFRICDVLGFSPEYVRQYTVSVRL